MIPVCAGSNPASLANLKEVVYVSVKRRGVEIKQVAWSHEEGELIGVDISVNKEGLPNRRFARDAASWMIEKIDAILDTNDNVSHLAEKCGYSTEILNNNAGSITTRCCYESNEDEGETRLALMIDVPFTTHDESQKRDLLLAKGMLLVFQLELSVLSLHEKLERKKILGW